MSQLTTGSRRRAGQGRQEKRLDKINRFVCLSRDALV